MAVKRYTQKQIDRVVAAAIAFVEGRIAGKSAVKVGKVTNEGNKGGRCAQFVRESFEAGLGLGEHEWAFGAVDANHMAAALRKAGYSIGDTGKLKPGDIVWRPSGAYGHIAIYVGNAVPGHEGRDLIAENTSSGTRGFPLAAGTKFTRRGAGTDEFGNWREVFRLGPA